MQKQVEKSHYDFNKYMSKARWASIWHQLDEVIKLKPHKVLEIGPGPGVFKVAAAAMGVHVQTLDIDPELNPDHLASVFEMPFEDDVFDVVCAFQMLEHLPFKESLKAFAEMTRVAGQHVVISLPNAQSVWRYVFHIPKFGEKQMYLPRPSAGPREHAFDGEHYWELNKKGYSVGRVIEEMSKFAQLVKQYRVPENPYHHFFIFCV